MSRYDRRPAAQNKKVGNGSGEAAEKAFDAECVKRGLHSFRAANDVGIDRVVYTTDASGKRTYKNVQITIASPIVQYNNKVTNMQVAKPISRLREDVDIVAICVPIEDEERNINTGKMGTHNMWLFLPADVYCDQRMYNNYCSTDNATWHISYKKHLKPPLDKALDAWYLFARKTFSKKLINSFF